MGCNILLRSSPDLRYLLICEMYAPSRITITVKWGAVDICGTRRFFFLVSVPGWCSKNLVFELRYLAITANTYHSAV